MPKVIEDLENRILEEAKKEISKNGVEGLKIRSIASKMNIATGTIYNYYSSKEKLVSSIILKGWKRIYSDMKKEALKSKTVNDCITSIASNYNHFALQYSDMLKNIQYAKQTSYTLPEGHAYLVQVLSDLLLEALEQIDKHPPKEVCWMVSELIIDLNNESKDFTPYTKYLETLINAGD